MPEIDLRSKYPGCYGSAKFDAKLSLPAIESETEIFVGVARGKQAAKPTETRIRAATKKARWLEYDLNLSEASTAVPRAADTVSEKSAAATLLLLPRRFCD